MQDTSSNWFGFDDLFWLTLFVLFGSALLGALLRRLRKDRCLKLFDNYHVTLLGSTGHPEWGAVSVTGNGIELVFDAPHVTTQGLIKASHLVPENELAGSLGLVRTVHALTADEQQKRTAQIERTFAPGLVSRFARRIANVRDMVSDSIGKSLTFILGNVAGPLGTAMASRKGEVNALGQTLAGVVTNAYEPLLERYIGREVVLECKNAPGAPLPSSEFAGYLVDYSDKYIAVFNATQVAESSEEINIETRSADAFTVSVHESTATFTCLGPTALVVCELWPANDTDALVDLDVTLLPGCAVDIRLPGPDCRARLEHTLRCDLVCPRATATVRYGSSPPTGVHRSRKRWNGTAPD